MALLLEDDKETKGVPISFGTTQDRKLFPHHCAFNRLGNLDGIRGETHLGPDKYNVDNCKVYQIRGMTLIECPTQFNSIDYNIKTRPTNKLGYSLGARSANRFPNLKCRNGYFAHDLSRGIELTFPGPTSYQNEEKKVVKKNKEPFNNSSLRFQPEGKHTVYQPAPGTYEHDVKRFRRVEFAGSFGGKQQLKETISIKCVQNNEDVCDSCKRPPIGDYFTYKTRALCRNCHSFHSAYGEKYPPSYLQAFSKVRDCSEIHHHDGTSAKIKLKDPKQERKQRYREAYFHQYFH